MLYILTANLTLHCKYLAGKKTFLYQCKFESSSGKLKLSILLISYF